MGGGQSLKSRFKRLFRLSLDKRACVREMGEWDGGLWRWKWRWRRRLSERELNCLNDLTCVLNNCFLKQDTQDTWIWKTGTEGHYAVKKAYSMLLQQKLGEMGEPREDFNLIWNKTTPLKVRINAWRIIWERIPTTTQLQRRNALPPNTNLNCPFCNEEQETVRHIFFECEFSYKIWMACLNWLGEYSVLPSNPSTNLLSFSRLFRGNQRRWVAVSIWECVVWLIWKTRNDLVFQHKRNECDKILEELKYRTWSWFQERMGGRENLCFEDWIAQPRLGDFSREVEKQ
ncbi:hypothetical protein ACS0TY_012601 [Phlomoides rotata]